MKTHCLMTIFVLSLLLIPLNHSYGAQLDWTFTRLTNNSIIDYSSSVWNGKVAFNSGLGRHSYDTFLWDGHQILQLTNNHKSFDWVSLYENSVVFSQSFSQSIDSISISGGNGRHWSDHMNGKIYLWENGMIRCINPDGQYSYAATIWGHQIAWTEIESNTIYSYQNNIIRNISDEINKGGIDPSLWNGKIAWENYDGKDEEIYYWDGNLVQQITNWGYPLHSSIVQYVVVDIFLNEIC